MQGVRSAETAMYVLYMRISSTAQRSRYVIEMDFGGGGEPCPRHLLNSCGCWLPPLTKLATLQCGEARQARILP